MAINVIVNSEKTLASNVIEVFYTSPNTGNGTVITAFTATNNTDSNRNYKAYIYDAGGIMLDAIIPLKIIIRSKTDLGAPIVNQFIPKNGTLRMETDLANSIVFRVSGKEL